MSKKLNTEQWKQSYIDRKDSMSRAVKKAMNNPELKQKLSELKNKAFIATNIKTGEILQFDSALDAMNKGFGNNTSIGQALKSGKPYKGCILTFV